MYVCVWQNRKFTAATKALFASHCHSKHTNKAIPHAPLQNHSSCSSGRYARSGGRGCRCFWHNRNLSPSRCQKCQARERPRQWQSACAASHLCTWRRNSPMQHRPSEHNKLSGTYMWLRCPNSRFKNLVGKLRDTNFLRISARVTCCLSPCSVRSGMLRPRNDASSSLTSSSQVEIVLAKTSTFPASTCVRAASRRTCSEQKQSRCRTLRSELQT